MSFSLAATRAPTASMAACLGCLARQSLAAGGRPTRPTAASGATVGAAAAAGPGYAQLGALPAVLSARQVRGKSGIHRHPGVVVRLLEDVPRFGRKDTILRAERGRMRNDWYPRCLAEYMTPARFAELGLSPATAIGERDALFTGETAAAVENNTGHDDTRSAADAARAALQAIDLDPARAAAVLATRLPPALVFRRRAIAASSGSGDSSGTSGSTTAIFGSVSTDDVAAAVREALRATGDEEARLVRVEARDVRFVVADEQPTTTTDDADRVKALGRFEVEIAIRSSGAAPVRKIVEVVAEE